jgi:ABC-type multidrug transport system fused ATPase/permease subunit
MVRQELIDRLRSINGEIAEVIFERNNREYSVLVYLVDNPLGVELIKNNLHWRIFKSISELEGSQFFLDRSFYIISANRFVSDYCYEPATLVRCENEYNEDKMYIDSLRKENKDDDESKVIETSAKTSKDLKIVGNFFDIIIVIIIASSFLSFIGSIGLLISTSEPIYFASIIGSLLTLVLCWVVIYIFKMLHIRFINATEDLQKIRMMMEK